MEPIRAFVTACTRRDLKAIASWLPQVDINQTFFGLGNLTPLIYAAHANSFEVVGLLLRYPQLDVNGTNSRGSTALHVACSRGCEETVSLLVRDPRVNLFQKNIDGATPLWFACVGGHVPAVELLLATGAKFDLEEESGDARLSRGRATPMDVAKYLVYVSADCSDAEGMELMDLFRRWEEDRQGTVLRLRLQHKWVTPAAMLFAQTIFLCDGFMDLEHE